MANMPQSQIHLTSPALLDPTSAAGELRAAILAKLTYVLGKSADAATDYEWYQATALAVRDRLVDIWMATRAETKRLKKKRVYYLSIEFLIGRLLLDTLTNLRLAEPARQALASLGVDLDKLRELEPDAALGNGGLGRLAACFVDSMSALGIPAYGYGIRYENGLFEQRLKNGWQQEVPEDWLSRGNPWEFGNTDRHYTIKFGGVVEYHGGDHSTARANWHASETVLAVPYDTLIGGWRGRHANSLRLWSARAPSPIQLSALNHGDVVGATAARARAEAISRVLYPNDATTEGQELRLRQEYFFTSASLQDLVRRHLKEFGTLDTLADHAAVQLNDTHPAIAVAELMRIIVDEHNVAWDRAWAITRATLSYTNHTLLPEALETWQVELFGRLLPRHLQIIYLINWYHLQETERAGLTDPEFLSNVSLVHENGSKLIRMAQLAYIGSHCVNGVSALHTDLLRKTVFHDIARTTDTRIVNKTNGITFRRWLYDANEPLTGLLVRTLGERVLDDPRCLRELEPLASDPDFVTKYRKTRTLNKWRLADILRQRTGIRISPHALFDVHIKRIHEYKRQLLNILETIALYQAIRERPDDNWAPRVKIFAGKAAASYERAKLIIKLANDVGTVINSDPVVGDRLKVVFAPNYSVKSRRADHPRCRSVGTDFHCWHGSFRHRQHEARAQRRHHDRHPRRRQRRNARARGRREHFYLRPHGARGSGAPECALQGRRGGEGVAAAGGGVGEPRRRRVLARRPLPLRAHRAGDQRIRPLHGGGRFRSLLECAARRRRIAAVARRLVAHRHPQHRAHELVFRRPRNSRVCGRHLARAGGLTHGPFPHPARE